MSISYTKVGDFLLPNLKINEEKHKKNLNKYALLWLNFIKKYKKSLKYCRRNRIKWLYFWIKIVKKN